MDADAACPVTLRESLAGIQAEGRALDVVLDMMRGPWHSRETRLPAWSLGELVAHLVRAADRAATYLDEHAPDVPEIGWLDYWRRAREADPAGVAERAAQQAAKRRPDELIDDFGAGWRRTVVCVEDEDPARRLPTPFGAMRIDHYLTTRVVEMTVHGLDVRASLGLEEVATPPALAVTCRVLEGLYGAGRPASLEDDVAFVLVATGRRRASVPGLPVLW